MSSSVLLPPQPFDQIPEEWVRRATLNDIVSKSGSQPCFFLIRYWNTLSCFVCRCQPFLDSTTTNSFLSHLVTFARRQEAKTSLQQSQPPYIPAVGPTERGKLPNHSSRWLRLRIPNSLMRPRPPPTSLSRYKPAASLSSTSTLCTVDNMSAGTDNT